jgi:hypothetical protein
MRLPTDDEWRQMAQHYGGVGNDSPDKGKAAYSPSIAAPTSASVPASLAITNVPKIAVSALDLTVFFRF